VRSSSKIERRSAAVAIAVAGFLAPARARGEVTYDLAPSAGVGVTDNANLTGTPLRDEFGILAGTARARYQGPKASHTVGYRVSWTYYFERHGVDNLSNEVMESSIFNLTPTLELHLNGGATLSRVSRIDLTNTAMNAVTNPTLQGVPGGTNLFLSLSAGEELVYEPNARWRYLESLAVTRVNYLDEPAPPTTTAVTARGRADRTAGVDSYSLEGTAAVTISASNTLIAELLAGWRREISPFWTSQLQAGAMAIFRDNGPTAYGPAGVATLDWRRQGWFASMTLSRTPTVNLFLGQPVVNNQGMVRLTLPLTKNETVVVSGLAGYTWANLASDQLLYAYDQQTAAVTLGSRLGRLPMYLSLEYTVLAQHNNPNVATPVPDLFRQVLMLNLTGAFTFGPGTPPILGAPM
jgi:hypothetical protein